MKCGGNLAAKEFFHIHGSDKIQDLKQKYQSRGAQLYKEFLAKQVLMDQKKNPMRIVIEGVLVEDKVKMEQQDFFDAWEEDGGGEEKKSPMTTITETFTFSKKDTEEECVDSDNMNDVEDKEFVEPVTQPIYYNPVIETSPTQSIKLGSSILKPKRGLGAKKVVKGVDFDQVEKKAQQLRLQQEKLDAEQALIAIEKEKEKKLNPIAYISKSIQDPSIKTPNSSMNNISEIQGRKKSITKSIPAVSANGSKMNEEMMDRLGIGFGSFGMTQVPVIQASQPSKYDTAVDAQKR